MHSGRAAVRIHYFEKFRDIAGGTGFKKRNSFSQEIDQLLLQRRRNSLVKTKVVRKNSTV
jgi:hypothetical protein